MASRRHTQMPSEDIFRLSLDSSNEAEGPGWFSSGEESTYNFETNQYVYPKAQISTYLERLAEFPSEMAEKVVELITPVIQFVNPDAGNLIDLVAKDLLKPASKSELDLIPVGTFLSIIQASDITDTCYDMINKKIARWTTQYAHDLALSQRTDIAISWRCSESGAEQKVFYMTRDQYDWVQQAVKHTLLHKGHFLTTWQRESMYKELDANTVHAQAADDSEGDGASEIVPSQKRGGFYTVVKKELLNKLSESFYNSAISIEIVVEPRLMSNEEREDMADYEAAQEVEVETKSQ